MTSSWTDNDDRAVVAAILRLAAELGCPQPDEAVQTAWLDRLSQYPVKSVLAAIRAEGEFNTSGWMPSVGKIVARVKDMPAGETSPALPAPPRASKAQRASFTAELRARMNAWQPPTLKPRSTIDPETGEHAKRCYCRDCFQAVTERLRAQKIMLEKMEQRA